MTLVIGIKSKHGIVIVGDRRNYNPVNASYDDTAVKVFKLNDKVAIAGAGNRFDCLEVIDEMITNPKIKEMSLEEIKDLMFITARSKQAEMINKSAENPLLILKGVVEVPLFAFILVGIADKNEPKIYSLSHNNLVPLLIKDNYIALGITDIAKYLLMKEYKDDMTLSQLEELATRSVKETSKISLGVNDICDVIKIKLHQSA